MSTRPGTSDGVTGPSSVSGSESDHRSFGFQEENIYKKKRDRTNNCHVERRFISDCHKYHKDTSEPATKSQTPIGTNLTCVRRHTSVPDELSIYWAVSRVFLYQVNPFLQHNQTSLVKTLATLPYIVRPVGQVQFKFF